MGYKPFLITFTLLMMSKTAFAQIQNPPQADKNPHKMEVHGHERIDDYYWIREREDAKVIDYLKAENRYTQKMLSPIKGSINALFKEMKSRIKQQDQSVPVFVKGYWYYTKYLKGKEYPLYCRKNTNLESGKEEVMLNVNIIAKGKEFCETGGVDVSDDNRLGAYPVDFNGRRFYDIYFINLQTGEYLGDVLKNTTGNLTWAADNKTVFYSKQDENTLRSNRIYKHRLGQPQESDELIFEEKDELFTCYVSRTKSDKFLLIHSSATLTDEVWYLDANKLDEPFICFLPRQKGHEYTVDHAGEYFYVRTNHDAKNFRIMKASASTSNEIGDWEAVVPHNDAIYIEGMEVFKRFLAVEQRQKGLTEILIKSWDGNVDHKLDFGEQTYSTGLGANPEFDTDLLRYTYTSLTTPNSTYDYNMATKAKTLKKQQAVLDSNFKVENYVSERHWATAKDGTQIPISLVYKKGLKLNGNNPTLIYAYGSYGASMDPYFSSLRLSLLDRGFVFAIAHVRGGQELGRDWYEDGKFLKKKNTFTDFNDCSEYLIDKKFTNPRKLAAMGGSAGGLLIGAVINMRPDLYKAAVAQVPFVDVVTTMLDETIPLTTGEFEEWGNPKDKQFYDYMLSYSPYDNVEKKEYPNLLVTSGLHDSQVQYWEPTKWVAKLREMKTDQNQLLLHTNMKAGHGGASGRFQALKEYAMEYGWLMKVLEVGEFK